MNYWGAGRVELSLPRGRTSAATRTHQQPAFPRPCCCTLRPWPHVTTAGAAAATRSALAGACGLLGRAPPGGGPDLRQGNNEAGARVLGGAAQAEEDSSWHNATRSVTGAARKATPEQEPRASQASREGIHVSSPIKDTFLANEVSPRGLPRGIKAPPLAHGESAPDPLLRQGWTPP
eukprot:scaffold2664_cov319-Prasinococcus_capsulatus_cf.AAC.4